MKKIDIHIHVRDGEEPRTITISEDSTVEDLLRLLSSSGHGDLHLVIGDEEKPRHRHERLCDCGIGHQHHIHCHGRSINYTVDGEPEETTKHLLTPAEIMRLAGVDPAKHYLIRLLPHGGEESFKDRPLVLIHMHEGMKFITASLCATPVS